MPLAEVEALAPYFFFAQEAIEREAEVVERFDGSTPSFVELCEARDVRLMRCQILFAELIKYGPPRSRRSS